jgi:uncharacterized SAM-binding protein YcdF (DUF218 family)
MAHSRSGLHNRQDRNRIMAPVLSLRVLVVGAGCFVATILFFLLVAKLGWGSGRSATWSATKTWFTDPNEIPVNILLQMDAVLILGGGKPSSLEEPPIYVQRRCDDAAAVVFRHKELSYTKRKNVLPILCLSAGTAHLPQLMSAAGLPIWESTASAAYLSAHFNLSRNVYVETTSYDTIGNAFYARTSHTDILGWRRLLVVTNEVCVIFLQRCLLSIISIAFKCSNSLVTPTQFHMARTRAIFDWIFGLDDRRDYKLYYLQSPNIGISDGALHARSEKEAKSVTTVEAFAKQYRSLSQVWSLLNTQHDLYTASKLVERGRATRSSDYETTDLIKKSYGGTR